MAADRAEPFQVALFALRERLRRGEFPAGGRIAASEIADVLKLSATPVREALSRLAGEGLLDERRGLGFFVRTLSALDVADLYRCSEALLLMAQDAERTGFPPGLGTPGPGLPVEDPSDPVVQVERLFAAWVHAAGGRAFAAAHRIVQGQLGVIRRVEPQVFADLATESAALAAVGEDRTRRAGALRQFHRRRIAVADRLALLTNRLGEPPEV